METSSVESTSPWWNLVVTSRDQGYRDVKRALKHYGEVGQTHFFNVLVAQVPNLQDFLHDFALDYQRHPYLQDALSRVRPLQNTFTFFSREMFETKIMDFLSPKISELEGKTFHVRITRRGEHIFSSLMEEQFLDQFIVHRLKSLGKSPPRISFEDPDIIIDIETLDEAGGISLWKKEDQNSFPFIRLD